jgi:Uri superfamily endonuclease
MGPDDSWPGSCLPTVRLPRLAATYVLVLRLPHPATIAVGQLGTFHFAPGWYAYVGSARGPGGLAARTSRHLRSPKPLHWHVDYVRTAVEPVEIWYALGAQKRECVWARVLAGLPGALIPAPRFGASDCRCPAHLVHFAALSDVAPFARAVGDAVLQEKLNV